MVHSKNKTKKQQDMPLFKAIVKIEITGFNQARILNTLSAKNITVKNIIRVSAKILKIEVSKKDSPKVFAILDEMCYTYSVLGESGILQIFKACARHAGFIAGAIVFIAAAIVLNSLIWRVDIGGNEAVSSQIIAKELENRGVKTGAFKHKIDLDAITAALRDIEGLAEGTIEVKGTTIYIRVLEEKDYIPPDGIEEPGDIISNYDAVITRVVAEKGVSAVSVGDIVKKDGVLIKGEIYDINGELTETCKAKGKVYGKVAFTSTHIFTATEYYHERTGNKETFTSLSLFSIKIGKKPQPDWEKVTTQEKMMFIPINVTRTVCYETELKERPRDISAHVEKLKDEELLQNVIKAGGSQLETVTTLTPLDNGLIMLNIHILAEMALN